MKRYMIKFANEGKVREITHGKDGNPAVSELGNRDIQKGY